MCVFPYSLDTPSMRDLFGGCRSASTASSTTAPDCEEEGWSQGLSQDAELLQGIFFSGSDSQDSSCSRHHHSAPAPKMNLSQDAELLVDLLGWGVDGQLGGSSQSECKDHEEQEEEEEYGNAPRAHIHALPPCTCIFTGNGKLNCGCWIHTQICP